MGPRILVIDDERSILETIRILLTSEGFDVVTSQTAREGMDEFDSFSPDIVLTDIRMPGMTGLDVLAAVQERDPQVPVILMTAQASLQSAVQAVNQGAFYY